MVHIYHNVKQSKKKANHNNFNALTWSNFYANATIAAVTNPASEYRGL
jgi:hypothetical protein